MATEVEMILLKRGDKVKCIKNDNALTERGVSNTLIIGEEYTISQVFPDGYVTVINGPGRPSACEVYHNVCFEPTK